MIGVMIPVMMSVMKVVAMQYVALLMGVVIQVVMRCGDAIVHN